MFILEETNACTALPKGIFVFLIYLRYIRVNPVIQVSQSRGFSKLTLVRMYVSFSSSIRNHIFCLCNKFLLMWSFTSFIIHYANMQIKIGKNAWEAKKKFEFTCCNAIFYFFFQCFMIFLSIFFSKLWFKVNLYLFAILFIYIAWKWSQNSK